MSLCIDRCIIPRKDQREECMNRIARYTADLNRYGSEGRSDTPEAVEARRARNAWDAQFFNYVLPGER